MELKQLTAFAAVYEEGSMSRAAERLQITQPNISIMIRKLEAELGATLFERHSGGTWPSIKADSFYPHVQLLLTQAATARAAVSGSAPLLQGLLRVGVAPTVARGVLFRQLPQFVDQYPGIDLRITEGMSIDLIDWTISGAFDFAIVTNPPDDRRLVVQRVGFEPMVLIAGPKSGRRSFTETDLTTSPPLRIVLPFGRHRPVGALSRFLSSHSIPIAQSMQTDSLTATLALVQRTDWVTILSVSAVSDQLDRFIVQKITNPAHDTEFFLVRPARATMSAAAQLFADGVKRGFQQSLVDWNELWNDGHPRDGGNR